MFISPHMINLALICWRYFYVASKIDLWNTLYSQLELYRGIVCKLF